MSTREPIVISKPTEEEAQEAQRLRDLIGALEGCRKEAFSTVDLLVNKAKGSDEWLAQEAARALRDIAFNATMRLTELAKSGNKAVIEVSREFTKWPAIVSPKANVTAEYSPLDHLQLGEEINLNLDGQWQEESAATKRALGIIKIAHWLWGLGQKWVANNSADNAELQEYLAIQNAAALLASGRMRYGSLVSKTSELAKLSLTNLPTWEPILQEIFKIDYRIEIDQIKSKNEFYTVFFNADRSEKPHESPTKPYHIIWNRILTALKNRNVLREEHH